MSIPDTRVLCSITMYYYVLTAYLSHLLDSCDKFIKSQLQLSIRLYLLCEFCMNTYHHKLTIL